MQYRTSMSNTPDWWATLICGLPDFAVRILFVPLVESSSKGSNRVLHGPCMSFPSTGGVSLVPAVLEEECREGGQEYGGSRGNDEYYWL